MKEYFAQYMTLDDLWLAKLLGALAGSGISLAYVLPSGKREAAIRFMTGITSGLVFGLPTGVWIANHLGISNYLNEFEIVLMGAAFASLTIWTALGFAIRFGENRIKASAKIRTDGDKPNGQ